MKSRVRYHYLHSNSIVHHCFCAIIANKEGPRISRHYYDRVFFCFRELQSLRDPQEKHKPCFGNCWSRGLMCHKLFASLKKSLKILINQTHSRRPQNMIECSLIASPILAAPLHQFWPVLLHRRPVSSLCSVSNVHSIPHRDPKQQMKTIRREEQKTFCHSERHNFPCCWVQESGVFSQVLEELSHF